MCTAGGAFPNWLIDTKSPDAHFEPRCGAHAVTHTGSQQRHGRNYHLVATGENSPRSRSQSTGPECFTAMAHFNECSSVLGANNPPNTWFSLVESRDAAIPHTLSQAALEGVVESTTTFRHLHLQVYPELLLGTPVSPHHKAVQTTNNGSYLNMTIILRTQDGSAFVERGQI